MAPKIQWKLRNLFAITTVAAIYFGLSRLLGEFTAGQGVYIAGSISMMLAATLILVIGVIYERKLPQWAKLVIALVFFAASINLLLVDTVQ